MTDPAIIFQRTHSGREEIHHKSHGLTQSERLVLIMVDGVSSAKEIRAKLPVLSDDRFERALQKLSVKELVVEVFMPVDGQPPDELERTIIDRFLQQDPMDPVTIIFKDPEDELGMLGQGGSMVQQAPATSREPAPNLQMDRAENNMMAAGDIPVLVVPAPMPFAPAGPEPALQPDDERAADALSAELLAKRSQRQAGIMPQMLAAPTVEAELSVGADPYLSPLAVHWGYWLIVSGLSFILGFILARATI